MTFAVPVFRNRRVGDCSGQHGFTLAVRQSDYFQQYLVLITPFFEKRFRDWRRPLRATERSQNPGRTRRRRLAGFVSQL